MTQNFSENLVPGPPKTSGTWYSFLMTSHRNHDHPATPQARAECRRHEHRSAARAKSLDTKAQVGDPRLHTGPWFIDNVPGYDQVTGYAPCMEQLDHCSSCGSTAWEDLETGDQGYTACCNEPVVHGICNGTHKPPVGA